MIDEIENIMEFQKLFLTIISEIRSQNMFTYPVETISLLRKMGNLQMKNLLVGLASIIEMV